MYALYRKRTGTVIATSKRLSTLKKKRKKIAAKRSVEVVRGVGRMINQSDFKRELKSLRIRKSKKR